MASPIVLDCVVSGVVCVCPGNRRLPAPDTARGGGRFLGLLRSDGYSRLGSRRPLELARSRPIGLDERCRRGYVPTSLKLRCVPLSREVLCAELERGRLFRSRRCHLSWSSVQRLAPRVLMVCQVGRRRSAAPRGAFAAATLPDEIPGTGWRSADLYLSVSGIQETASCAEAICRRACICFGNVNSVTRFECKNFQANESSDSRHGRRKEKKKHSTTMQAETVAELKAENIRLRAERDELAERCAVFRQQRDETDEKLMRVTAELISGAEVAYGTSVGEQVEPETEIPDVCNPRSSRTRIRRAMRRSKEECHEILNGREVDSLFTLDDDSCAASSG